MRKRDELVAPNGCLNSALPLEWVFVLIGRDPAAPVAIRAWCAERIRLGKNVEGDELIREARACADAMDDERAHLRMELGKTC